MKTTEHTIKIQVPEGYKPGNVGPCVFNSVAKDLSVYIDLIPDPPTLLAKDAIAGRWYESKQYGRMLCCGTGSLGEWLNSFAIRVASGRTMMKFFNDHVLTESSEQCWED